VWCWLTDEAACDARRVAGLTRQRAFAWFTSPAGLLAPIAHLAHDGRRVPHGLVLLVLLLLLLLLLLNKVLLLLLLWRDVLLLLEV